MTAPQPVYVLMIEDGAEARDPREGSRMPAVSVHRSHEGATRAVEAYAKQQLADFDPPAEIDPENNLVDQYFNLSGGES